MEISFENETGPGGYGNSLGSIEGNRARGRNGCPRRGYPHASRSRDEYSDCRTRAIVSASVSYKALRTSNDTLVMIFQL